MAENKNTQEIALLESGMAALAGFNHLLVTLAVQMGLPAGTLYRLGTPEGQETLLAATKAFLAEVAKTAVSVWRTVVSGLTRDQLVAGAKAKGREMNPWVYQLIAKMAITSGITYRLVIILGEEFATDAQRTFASIRAEGARRGYPNPPAEVALLLAQFTQEELGGHHHVVVMHAPISDSNEIPHVLGVRRFADGVQWVDAWNANPKSQFNRQSVFVFLAPQGVVV